MNLIMQDSATVGIYSLLQPSEADESKVTETVIKICRRLPVPFFLKLIYADIGPNLVTNGENKQRLLIPLPDDRIEYAQLQHQSQPLIHSQEPISICDVGRCSLLLFMHMYTAYILFCR